MANYKLTDHAQSIAVHLSEKGHTTWKRSTPYGENIYIGYSDDPQWEIVPEEPVKVWYQESRYYKYGETQPRNLKFVCSFTQVVWKETKSMGLGMVVDKGGKVYVVCNYEPAGNVEGEFAHNVLPPKDINAELPLSEELDVKFVEPKVEVVRSMERLYAVPSEKLRVWTVWLSKVGEVANEWQKWLRFHIDLTIQIIEYLQAAEDEDDTVETKKFLPTSQESAEALDEGKSARMKNKIYSQEYEESFEMEESPAQTSGFEEQSGEEESPGTIHVTDAETLPNVAEAEETPTTNGRAPSLPEDQDVTVLATAPAENTEDVSTSEGTDEKENVKIDEVPEILADNNGKWPIGTRWKPLEQKIEKEPDKVEKDKPPEVPTNEEQMLRIITNFVHQATIYRSYYKHWKETADQAVKEIASRVVMPTCAVRKVDDKNVPDLNDARATTINASALEPYDSTVTTVDSPVTPELSELPTENVTEEPQDSDATTNVSVEENSMPPESTNENPETIPQDDTVNESSDTPDAANSSQESAQNPTDLVIPAEDAKKKPSPLDTSSKTENTVEQSLNRASFNKAEKLQPDTKCKETEILRDMARANEDIPYFFYLRAEPDVEIAIEHNDEIVILPDPNREYISSDYKRLYFNLTDKPGKGGKPWF